MQPLHPGRFASFLRRFTSKLQTNVLSLLHEHVQSPAVKLFLCVQEVVQMPTLTVSNSNSVRHSGQQQLQHRLPQQGP